MLKTQSKKSTDSSNIRVYAQPSFENQLKRLKKIQLGNKQLNFTCNLISKPIKIANYQKNPAHY